MRLAVFGFESVEAACDVTDLLVDEYDSVSKGGYVTAHSAEGGEHRIDGFVKLLAAHRCVSDPAEK